MDKIRNEFMRGTHQVGVKVDLDMYRGGAMGILSNGC